MAIQFYKDQNIVTAPALEVKMPSNPMLMQCRYCIRHALGYCTHNKAKQQRLAEPLYLRMSDGRKFKLQFDCSKCQMNILTD